MKKILDYFKRHKYISALIISVIAILVVCAMPISNKMISVCLETEGLAEGTAYEFEISSPSAYNETVTVPATVTNGQLLFRLDYEYFGFEEIEVPLEIGEENITELYVYSSCILANDFIASSLSDEDILVNSNQEFLLSDAAEDAIRDGIDNSWYLKLMLILVIVIILTAYIFFNLMIKYFGKFKTFLALAVGIIGLLMIITLKFEKVSSVIITINGLSLSNGVLAALVIAFFTVIIMVTVLCKPNSKATNKVILGIYACIFLFSTFKCFFYTDKVARTPDEDAHIAYLVHLEETDEIIPKYEDMRMLGVLQDDNEVMKAQFVDGTVNYLGHPPLYYHIVRLVNGVDFLGDGTISVNLDRIRSVSIIMVLAAIAIMFYIGYTRINKEPIVHLLYAMICTGVPMFAYGASGLNNDNLTVLTVAVFFLGIIRYVEKKRNFATYLLIAIGISATVLTKLTAGLMVLISAIVLLTITLIKEKCWKELLSWQFLSTLAVYCLPLIFFLFMYSEYGSFRPSIFKIDGDYARSLGFYVDVNSRATMGVLRYLWYYSDKFMESWTAIASEAYLYKTDISWFAIQNVALISIWFIPALMLIKKIRNNTRYSIVSISALIGITFTIIAQIHNGYKGFYVRGYIGGFQSRYYLCAIGLIAFCICMMAEKLFDVDKRTQNAELSAAIKKISTVAIVIFVWILAFEDFIYFIAYFTNYFA